MKIALIGPSNKLFMPYINSYINFFKEESIEYTLINWDRTGIEEYDCFVYRDSKTGHRRSYLDYFKFYIFLRKILEENDFDRLIIFGLQISFFLRGFLKKRFRGKYIIDVRDYNRIIKIYSFRQLINKSTFTVISSPAFKNWLPRMNKYVVNHNTQNNTLKEMKGFSKEGKVRFSYIGALRDLDTNINMINSLKNSKNIIVIFHGYGVITHNLENYINKNHIENVCISGKYENHEETALYNDTELINGLISGETINDKTLLPNRLYNSVIFAKPLIVLDGTYLSTVVMKYNLGLVIQSVENLEDKITEFIEKFEINKYNEGRKLFIKRVIEENHGFYNELREFCSF